MLGLGNEIYGFKNMLKIAMSRTPIAYEHLSRRSLSYFWKSRNMKDDSSITFCYLWIMHPKDPAHNDNLPEYVPRRLTKTEKRVNW